MGLINCSVLNLIINGIPSIPEMKDTVIKLMESFKPYYKWNTFNTQYGPSMCLWNPGFKPYYKWNTFNTKKEIKLLKKKILGFKPYYKWNTFNTYAATVIVIGAAGVLNLIINGIPSILQVELLEQD